LTFGRIPIFKEFQKAKLKNCNDTTTKCNDTTKKCKNTTTGKVPHNSLTLNSHIAKSNTYYRDHKAGGSSPTPNIF
jgi:hypothetical protein